MRFELIPNIPCPHCEKQNTTHRLVRKEDGFTKVSRRCTSCGNEWTHTWDRDWLADAKIKRLSAEIEKLRAGIQSLAERLEVDPSGTDKIDDLELETEELRGSRAAPTRGHQDQTRSQRVGMGLSRWR